MRTDTFRNSGTPYRQLLEIKLIKPNTFYEIGCNPYSNSQVYTKYLEDIGAHIYYIDDITRKFAAYILMLTLVVTH